MVATRPLIVVVVPATVIAARFMMMEGWDSALTLFFVVTGFIATFLGCSIAVFVLRKSLQRVPAWVMAAASTVIAAILLSIVPTMPSWPFTDLGFIIAWVGLSATLSGGLLFILGIRYA